MFDIRFFPQAPDSCKLVKVKKDPMMNLNVVSFNR